LASLEKYIWTLYVSIGQSQRLRERILVRLEILSSKSLIPLKKIEVDSYAHSVIISPRYKELDFYVYSRNESARSQKTLLR